MLHTCTYLYTCFPYMLPLHHNQPPTMLFLCFSMCCSTHDSWLPFFLRFSLVAWQHLVSCQGTPVMDGSKLLNWKHSILEGVFLPEDTLNPPIERFGFVQQGSGISNEIPWFLVLESFFSHSIHVCFCLTYINPTRINYSVMWVKKISLMEGMSLYYRFSNCKVALVYTCFTTSCVDYRHLEKMQKKWTRCHKIKSAMPPCPMLW